MIGEYRSRNSGVGGYELDKRPLFDVFNYYRRELAILAEQLLRIRKMLRALRWRAKSCWKLFVTDDLDG